MRKRIYLIPILGCFLFFSGCSVQNSSNVVTQENLNKENDINLELELENLEEKIGLEKIRNSDQFSFLASQISDKNFIEKRRKALTSEILTEEAVLECANRSIEISNLLNEDPKIFSIELLSTIDRIDLLMSRELILKLINKIYLLGNLNEVSLLEKDSKDLLSSYYIATTLDNAISNNKDFSDDERLALLKFLSNFKYLNYKISEATNFDAQTLDLMLASYDEERNNITTII